MGLGALMKKEFLQFFREKLMAALVLFIFLEPLLYGPTLSLEVNHLPMGVYDLDRSESSRALVARFQSVPNFDLKYDIRDDDELDELLQKGSISLALVIPADYTDNLAMGMPARVQLITDGSNSQIATTAMGYAGQVIGSLSRQIEIERLGLDQDKVKRLPGITASIRAMYDPELDFVKFGVLTMVIPQP